MPRLSSENAQHSNLGRYVRTLLRTSQARLVRTPDSIGVDLWYLQETSIQDPGQVTKLSTIIKDVSYYLRHPGSTEADTPGQMGPGMILNDKAEATLLERTPVSNRLCCTYRGPCKTSKALANRHCLFVISTYAAADYSPYAEKDRFCQRLHGSKTDIVVLHYAVVDCIASSEHYLVCPSGSRRQFAVARLVTKPDLNTLLFCIIPSFGITVGVFSLSCGAP